jgi:hypothetical protein
MRCWASRSCCATSDGRRRRGLRQRWLGHIDEAGRHLLALIDDVLDLSRAGRRRPAPEPAAGGAGELVAATPAAGGARGAHAPGGAGGHPAAGRRGAGRPAAAAPGAAEPAVQRHQVQPPGRPRAGVGAARAGGRLQVADTGRGIDAAVAAATPSSPSTAWAPKAWASKARASGWPSPRRWSSRCTAASRCSSRRRGLGLRTVTLPRASAAAGRQPAPATAGAPHRRRCGARRRLTRPPGPRALHRGQRGQRAAGARGAGAARLGALETAADGRSGLQRARRQPDLVLLDMQLPDMDGIAVLQALRADPATAACAAWRCRPMPCPRTSPPRGPPAPSTTGPSRSACPNFSSSSRSCCGRRDPV